MPSLSRARAGKRRPLADVRGPAEIAVVAAPPTPRRSSSSTVGEARRPTAVEPSVGAGSSRDTVARTQRHDGARSCHRLHRAPALRGRSPRYFDADDRAPPARGPLARDYVPDSDRCTEILIQFGTSFERPVRQPAGKGERRYGENSWPLLPAGSAGHRNQAELREKKNAACRERGAARWVYAWSTADPAIGGRVTGYCHASVMRRTMNTSAISRLVASQRGMRDVGRLGSPSPRSL